MLRELGLPTSRPCLWSDNCVRVTIAVRTRATKKTNQTRKITRTMRVTLVLVIYAFWVSFLNITGSRGLSHIDNGAALLKSNFVHQGFHQKSSAAMTGLNVFWVGRVWDCPDVKSLSFVPDDDGNLACPTATTDVNMLPRIPVIAMNHGVRQGLAQCDFNVLLASRNPFAFSDQVHDGFYKWRNCSNFTS